VTFKTAKENSRTWAPFISILILIIIGLATIFIKMEVVSMGYEVLRLGHAYKEASEKKSRFEVQYAKLIRPSRLDKIAGERLSLSRAQKNQVVMMNSQGDLALRQ
jgi:hypothetical protein